MKRKINLSWMSFCIESLAAFYMLLREAVHRRTNVCLLLDRENVRGVRKGFDIRQAKTIEDR